MTNLNKCFSGISLKKIWAHLCMDNFAKLAVSHFNSINISNELLTRNIVFYYVKIENVKYK